MQMKWVIEDLEKRGLVVRGHGHFIDVYGVLHKAFPLSLNTKFLAASVARAALEFDFVLLHVVCPFAAIMGS